MHRDPRRQRTRCRRAVMDDGHRALASCACERKSPLLPTSLAYCTPQQHRFRAARKHGRHPPMAHERPALASPIRGATMQHHGACVIGAASEPCAHTEPDVQVAPHPARGCKASKSDPTACSARCQCCHEPQLHLVCGRRRSEGWSAGASAAPSSAWRSLLLCRWSGGPVCCSASISACSRAPIASALRRGAWRLTGTQRPPSSASTHGTAPPYSAVSAGSSATLITCSARGRCV